MVWALSRKMTLTVSPVVLTAVSMAVILFETYIDHFYVVSIGKKINIG
jgi:hypothetical protein